MPLIRWYSPNEKDGYHWQLSFTWQFSCEEMGFLHILTYPNNKGILGTEYG